MQVVELSALMKNLCLWRVEILGLTLREQPAAESHRPAPQIKDREQESSAETGAHHAILSFRGETGSEQDGYLDSESRHCFHERLAVRGESQAQHAGVFQLNIAVFEVVSGGASVGRFAHLPSKPIVGDRDGGVEWLVRIACPPIEPLRYGDPGPASDLADRIRIAHPCTLHEPGEYVARFTAHETVETALFGDDGEVTVSTPMKWTGSPVIRTGPCERNGLADDSHQVGGVADLIDDLIRDHAHPENSTIVTPVPPW